MTLDGLLLHQHTPTRHLLDVLSRRGAGLDASDMGVGKTYAACAIVRELRKPALVVCPKSIRTAWHRVAAYMGTDISTINWEMVRTGRTQCGKWLDPKCKQFRWDKSIGLLIFDEAARGKAPGTLNAKIMAAAKGIPTLCLTGTPATSPLELRALAHLLDLCDWRQFWNWSRHFGCGPGPWGGFVFDGDQNQMLRLHKLIFPERGVRIRWQDVPGFPECIIQPGLYDAGTRQEIDDAYRAIAQERIGNIREVTRSFMRVEKAKIPVMIELADDALAAGSSVVLFCNFRETAARLQEAMKDDGLTCDVVQGDQDDEYRQRAIDDFQANKTRVLIANNAAGGVGLSLHDLEGDHPRAAIISPSLSPATVKQVLGRIWRVGGKSKVIQKMIYLAGTIEEQVKVNVERKISCLETLNDGDLNPNIESETNEN